MRIAHEYDRGQVIFYEGNPPLAVYCIASGVVKLYKSGSRDRRVVIRLLGPGETLGYRALIANEPYAATAEAVEPTTVCAVPKEAFAELMENDHTMARRLMAKLARELKVSEDELVSRVQHPVRKRTARFLLWVLENLQGAQRAKDTIAVPLLREEMAQVIGTTAETLSRTLRQLTRERVLEVDRTTIAITDRRALRRIADQ